MFFNFRNGREGKIGNIHIHRGRPKWSSVFNDLQQEFSDNSSDAGVLVCGPKALSNSLKLELAVQNTEKNLNFHLHSENF